MCLTVSSVMPSAATKIRSICPKCGIIQKSGKVSCCGHGGSWFKNCGSVGNTKLDHTWKEGIRVCNARQWHVAVGQQLEGSQFQRNISSDDAKMDIINSDVVILTAHMFASTPANKSTPLSDAGSITVPANISVITPDRVRKFTSKAISATNTTITPTSGKILTSQQFFSRQGNGMTIKSMHGASPDGFTTTTSRTSASASITARETEQLLSYVIAHISTILIVVRC